MTAYLQLGKNGNRLAILFWAAVAAILLCLVLPVSSCSQIEYAQAPDVILACR